MLSRRGPFRHPLQVVLGRSGPEWERTLVGRWQRIECCRTAMRRGADDSLRVQRECTASRVPRHLPPLLQLLYLYFPLAPTLVDHTYGRGANMDRLDQRSQRVRQARIALIRAVHRKIIAREDSGLATLKPLLPADIDAAWDARARTR
jgi:hypothetical protein